VIGPALQTERIEIGDHVPARAIGADQIHRAQRIERRLVNFLRQSRRNSMPVGGRHGHGVAVRDQSCGRAAPAWAFELLLDRLGLIAELGKEMLPALVDARRIFDIAGVELGDVLGVLAGQEAQLIGLCHG